MAAMDFGSKLDFAQRAVSKLIGTGTD